MNNNRNSKLAIHIAGFICLLCYVAVYALSAQFAADVPLIERPILPVLGYFVLAFAVYACVFIYFRDVLSNNAEVVSNNFGILELFLWGLAFRLIVWPSVPIQEVDIYRYVWDGAVSEAGVDPYAYSPLKVRELAGSQAEFSVENEGMRPLVDELHQREGLRDVVNKVHYEHLTTLYPPVSQWVFHSSAKIAGPDATESQYLRVFKAIMLLFDMATALAVIGLLRRAGMRPQLFVGWWWCPLVIKEFANSGHLDSIAVFLLTLSALLLVIGLGFVGKSASGESTQLPTTEQGVTRFGYCVVSCFALALAVGAKLFPVVLAPIWAVCIFKRYRWAVVIPAIVFCSATVVVCWPMVSQTALVQSVMNSEVSELQEEKVEAEVKKKADSGSGIEAFYDYWEMNDLLFLIVVENLKPNGMVKNSPAWFVVMPDDWRVGLNRVGGRYLDAPEDQIPFRMARLVYVGSFFLVIVGLCWKLFRNQAQPDTPLGVLNASFLVLAWLWFLGPVQNPWYWTWALPFLPFAKNKWWFAVSGLSLAYYLRFWFEGHFAQVEVWPTPYIGIDFFYFVVPWIEFGPFLILLAISSIHSRRKIAV